MRTFVFGLLFAFASLTQATPGGMDAKGCHHSQKKGWHCHAARVKTQAKDSGETPAQRDKRLLRECKGLPNAGACLGYTR